MIVRFWIFNDKENVVKITNALILKYTKYMGNIIKLNIQNIKTAVTKSNSVLQTFQKTNNQSM
jgi:hypothetical protein